VWVVASVPTLRRDGSSSTLCTFSVRSTIGRVHEEQSMALLLDLLTVNARNEASIGRPRGLSLTQDQNDPACSAVQRLDDQIMSRKTLKPLVL